MLKDQDRRLVMNNLNTATNRRLAAAMICGVLGVSYGAASIAADGSGAPQAIVKFGDLNVSNSLGAATLYSRITVAAGKVCRSFEVDSRDLASMERLGTCINKSIAEAVFKVRQPALFAIYDAKNHKPLPILVAAARIR
jgi:UrcA family protein